MKTKLLLLLSIFGFLSQGNLNAQEVCGTTTPVNYQDYQTSSRNSVNDEAICINIYFHIVRETNGTGGISSNQLDNIVNNLNLFYNVFDIYFTNIGFDYIDNSNYLQVSESEANTLGQINNQSNAINYYIVDALWNTGGGFVTGTALSIPSNRLIIRSDRVLSSTSPHEVGHCLNLLHTFETYYCAEAINGSNCSSCGDLVCDTPADANTGNSGGYSPDLTNIMSYYSIRDHFTDGQSNRMKSAILNNSLLQQVVGTTCSVPEINGSEIICNSLGTTYTILNGGNSVTWNISSNLTILSQSSNSITLKPITTSANGAGFVEAVLPTQTLRKNIWIGKPRITSARLDNGQYLAHGSTTTNKVCKYEPIKTNISFGGTSYASWSMISSSHTTSWSQQGDNISFYLWAVNHTATFRITLNNGCGTFTRDYTFNIKDCSGGGNDPCDPIMSISQNPVDTEIEVINIPAPCDPVLSKSGNNDKLLKNSTATLYDISGNPVKSKTPFDGKMNVEKVKAGLYILVVTTNGVKNSFRIIIN